MNEIHVDEINAKRYKNFNKKYKSLKAINTNTAEKIYLGSKTKRKCRFCGKSRPHVSFKNDAHVIPQFLGNRNVLSYFECDYCNELFSKYEDSFASFFSAFRTFANIKGQKGVPKYKDPFSGFEISRNSYLVKMASHDLNDYNIDEKNKTIYLNTVKESYIPLYVYKSLVKIGLCLISNEQLDKYSKSIAFLLEKSSEDKYNKFPFARMFSYFIPGPPIEMKPIAVLFTKLERNKDNNYPHSTLVLHIPNHLLQIFIPFCSYDKHMYKIGYKIDLPIYPLTFDFSWFKKYGDYQFNNIDLSTNVKREKEKVDISIKYTVYGCKKINLKY